MFTRSHHLSLYRARSIQFILPFYYLNIHFNIIIPLLKWSLSLRSPRQNPVCTSLLHLRSTCPVNLVLLDLITRIIFGEGCRSRSSLLCSLPARQCDCVVKLTTRLRLLSRLRTSGAIPLFPIYAFMARTGTTLSYLTVTVLMVSYSN